MCLYHTEEGEGGNAHTLQHGSAGVESSERASAMEKRNLRALEGHDGGRVKQMR